MFIREKAKGFEKMMGYLQKHHESLTERSRGDGDSVGSQSRRSNEESQNAYSNMDYQGSQSNLSRAKGSPGKSLIMIKETNENGGDKNNTERYRSQTQLNKV